MICTTVRLPDGTTALVCGTGPRFKKCKCGSGLKADLLCDWKVAGGETCDAEICSACSTSPAPDKDLCPTHTREWRTWRHARAAP